MPSVPSSADRRIVQEPLAFGELIARLPAPVLAVTELTTLHARHTLARTARLDLADGTRYKGRLLESEAHADRVERLSAVLDRAAFPPVLARCGRAILEPWVDGQPLKDVPDDPDAARRLGAILGGLHAVTAPMAPGQEWSGVEGPLDRMRRDLGALAATRTLARRDGARLLAMAEADLPDAVPCGIVHRDAAPENAVRTADGSLVMIDNTTLDVRPVDYDLARTWYRWPMGPAAADAFRSAYGTHRAVGGRGERFWRIGVLAEVVCWRRSAGLRGTSRAVAALRAMAAA